MSAEQPIVTEGNCAYGISAAQPVNQQNIEHSTAAGETVYEATPTGNDTKESTAYAFQNANSDNAMDQPMGNSACETVYEAIPTGNDTEQPIATADRMGM